MDVGTNQQQAGLGQAAPALVHGHGGHIGSCRHGRHRESAAKIEMGAVGLIHQAKHAGAVGHLYNGPQIAANPIVRGIVHQHRHGVRVLCDCLGNLLPLHTQRNPQPLIHLRVYIYRHRAAQNQRIDDAFVDIAR